MLKRIARLRRTPKPASASRNWRRPAAHVGALLRAQGSRPGDTVSLIMPNGLMTLQLLLGAMHGGWVVNPVNLLSQPDQMRYVLMHSDCKVVIVAPDWETRVRALLAGLERPVTLLVIAPDADQLPAISGEARIDAAREAKQGQSSAGRPHTRPHHGPTRWPLLMYTSGTTGVPKGVMLTQANLAANAQAISAEHALTPIDRVLAVLPLYHINAFAVTMLAPAGAGRQPGDAAEVFRCAFLGPGARRAAAPGSTWCRR